MNIFEALRQSHDIQRELTDQLIKTRGDSEERRELFDALKNELDAHSIAEDRFFHVPLMPSDKGLELARHGMGEHHEIDDLVEQLEELEFSDAKWITTAKELAELVHHHLKEEEHSTFQQAGKVLNEEQKKTLAEQYLSEYQKYKKDSA